MQVKNEMIHSKIVDARQALIPYKDKGTESKEVLIKNHVNML